MGLLGGEGREEGGWGKGGRLPQWVVAPLGKASGILHIILRVSYGANSSKKGEGGNS